MGHPPESIAAADLFENPEKRVSPARLREQLQPAIAAERNEVQVLGLVIALQSFRQTPGSLFSSAQFVKSNCHCPVLPLNEKRVEWAPIER